MESLIDFGGETGAESDGESDLIFECPGLAPTGEMVVTNPFFMHQVEEEGKEDMLRPVNSESSSIRHANIRHTDRQTGVRLLERQSVRPADMYKRDRYTHRHMLQAH